MEKLRSRVLEGNKYFFPISIGIQLPNKIKDNHCMQTIVKAGNIFLHCSCSHLLQLQESKPWLRVFTHNNLEIWRHSSSIHTQAEGNWDLRNDGVGQKSQVWGTLLLCYIYHIAIHLAQAAILLNIYWWCCVVLSCVWLSVIPWTKASQAPLSMGFPRQEFWSRLPFPSPGDLPDPGIEPASLSSPALGARFFISCTTWKTPTCQSNHVSLICLSCVPKKMLAASILPFILFPLLTKAKHLQRRNQNLGGNIARSLPVGHTRTHTNVNAVHHNRTAQI